MENDVKMFRVLSIDGGGIKGLIPLFFLDLLEKLTGKPIYDLFDFFSGTSIGGIMSIFFSQRIFTAGELLVKMLGQLKNKIFPSKRLISFLLMKKSLYDPKIIETVLQELIKENKLNISFKNSKGNFLVTGSEVLKDTCQPFIFVNYKNNPECFRVSFDPKKQDFFQFIKTDLNHDLQMWEIGRITSAAYPCFAVYKNIEGFEFLDGGYTYNNPSYLAIKYIEEMLNIDLKKVFMLSLGCNSDISNQNIKIDFLKKNVLNLGSEFLSNLDGMFDNMNNSAYSSLLLADSYLGKRHVRISPIRMKDISLDSVDNSTMLDIQYTARKMIKDFEEFTIPICKELGITDSQQFILMAKKSKYFIYPRYYKYREYYQRLDCLASSDITPKNIEEIYEFNFPPDVRHNEKIIKFSKNQGGIISWMGCGCNGNENNFSLASLALIIGHLDILKKFAHQISDPFNFIEFGKWTPFHYAAANGELAGIMLLLENDYLVPGTICLYSNCLVIEFRKDISNEKLEKLRDAFVTFKGKKYDRKNALKNETPLYFAQKYERNDIINFFDDLEKMINKTNIK